MLRAMKRFCLLLAACALFACSSPQPSVSVVNPPEKYVNFDPSTVDGGLAAQVGFQVFSPLGDKSWTKTGTGNSQWTQITALTANANGALAEVAYTSPPVDLTTTPTATIVPAAPSGFVFVPVRLFEVNGTVTGTVTGAPTVSVGNNGNSPPNNVISASALLPNVAGLNLGPNGQSNAAIAAGVVYGTNAYVVTVTAAQTGASVASVRYSLVGYWQPLP